MSPPHAYTLGVIPSIHQPDDDDDDICPICEGACTCNNQSVAPAPPPPSTPRATSSYASSSRSSPPNSRPPKPTQAPLKIKLTLPPSLLARARLPVTPHASSSSSKKQNGATDSQEPKRRGRPPKAPAAARTAFASAASKTKGKKPTLPRSKPRDTTGKLAKRKLSAPVASDDDYFPAGAAPPPGRRGSDEGRTGGGDIYDDEDELDGTRPAQLPIFVPALSSSSSEESSSSSGADDSSELSDFSDSSMEDEEERYIQAEVHQQIQDKARVKRELLGDEKKWKERRNTWEIQTRKKSVDPSGDEMDVDSDETEEDGEEEAAVKDEEANDGEDEDEDDMSFPSTAYAGIATGWSEDDEEARFDAELFFASLTDSESADAREDGDETVDEDDVDDEAMLELNAMALAARGVFEVTEGWDGSVIFTNGLQDGQGLLDWDFEANAAQLLVETTSSGSGSDTDVQMSDGESNMGDSEDADDGLEELESDDGDTTEEELVDDQGLPTARAMRLFRPPTTPLSSINPLSTMTPGPRPHPADGPLASPKPEDILAGRVYWDDDEDDNDSMAPPVSDVASLSLTMSSDWGTPKPPSMGTFSAGRGDALRRAVIDGSRQDLPSPFPRSHRRRLSESASGRSLSRSRHSRDRSLSLSQTSFALSPSPFGLPTPSDDIAPPTSPDFPPAEPIRLDDVLDASLLDSDPYDPATYLGSSSTAEAETSAAEDERHLQSLSRWDRIPMGTFRRTRESGLMSDGAGEYGGMLRNSPFSSMWTAGKPPSPSSSPLARKAATKKRGKGRMDVVISPVILPVRDGDHTPTGAGQGGYTPPHAKPRKERESRRDKAMKRKAMMSSTPGRRHQQQNHHHGHHPNGKGRAAGSVQRAGFGGAVPPLSL
ncbi:hypothetical protein FA95DRAFT_1608270 [Auriscalpium vulgare]|uniref:Uncharacterized protein n=1 Tax=Auriscalpium vulgare TaxID=40419 RepID=A0ACB8RKK6_9AGAM|nr:hypothetical protein FA95DRAFT_1608270 [Auriscalpium vulgare]